LTTAETAGTCGIWSPSLPNGSHPPTQCDLTTNASTTVYNRNGDGKYECKYQKNSEGYHYASCTGYTPAGTVDNGPCDSTPATNYGTCISNNTGPCVLGAQAVATKSKVAFQQSLQACWALRKGTDIGVDDINTVINQCSDVFGSYASCSNDHMLTCDPTVAGSCGAGNTCQTGPYAIDAGSHALLCGQSFEGQYYQQNSSGAWVLRPGYDKNSTAMHDTHVAFCNQLYSPPVTDPTDAPSNTPSTDNLPAIISGVGVESQLGAPKATMRAKVAVATPACTTTSDCPQSPATGQFTTCDGGVCKPSGLLQQFASSIRLGAMRFNQYGSATESTLAGVSVGVPKTCDNGTICTQPIDCGSITAACTPTTAGTSNLDGGRILYPIGWGYCATMTSTQCTDDTSCTGFDHCLNNGYCGTKGSTRCTTALKCSGSNQACISDDAGNDHVTTNTLVNALDTIQANAWTPFSEAFYNAIGYFAAVPQADGTFKSRVSVNNITGMRLNAGDFDETYNPSESRCQQNYILLISDGSSTADRNEYVNTMATLYAPAAGIAQTACTGAPSGTTTDYGGNNNLPIMSWIAKNRRIYDVNVSGSASTTTSAIARDSISTFVVFNGESNGASGDCNSLTLLSKTAANGGTALK
jgi:type IV pilus assembly protein PilY1